MTHNHLLILTYPDAFPLDDLQILEAAQDIVLHPESSLHAELRALFDGEGLRFQRLNRAGGGQVDGDVRAALDLEGQGADDAASLV